MEAFNAGKARGFVYVDSVVYSGGEHENGGHRL